MILMRPLLFEIDLHKIIIIQATSKNIVDEQAKLQIFKLFPMKPRVHSQLLCTS